MPDRRDKDPTEHFLVERFAPEQSTDDPCPGPGLIAGYAERRLLPEERERVEEHVARCEACRVLAAELLDEAPVAARTVRTRRWLAATTAAAALVAIAVWWGQARDKEPQLGTEDLLFASATDLARGNPGLFGEFVPLSREERLARRSGERGALVALYPAGLVIDARPPFRWEPAPGVDEYSVAVFTADGETWHATTAKSGIEYPAGQPPLQPGQQYSWEVAYRGGPFGDDSAQRAFSVATAEQRASFEQGVRRIDAVAPAEVAELLKAHYAIRGKFYREAEASARAFLDAHPRDKVARETLFQVLELLGSSEADDVLDAGG
jgi:hypothetical protein